MDITSLESVGFPAEHALKDAGGERMVDFDVDNLLKSKFAY